MMRFLIFSDIHGKYRALCEVMERQVQLPDGVIFLGDGVSDIEYFKGNYPGIVVYGVCGNCDIFYRGSAEDYPLTRELNVEGVKLFLTHGHRYGVKSSITSALAKAYECGADALLFGHTHTPLERYLPAGSELCGRETERPIYAFNPGSLGQNDGEGYSFGTLTINRKTLLFGHGRL